MVQFIRTAKRIVSTAHVVAIEELDHQLRGQTYCRVTLTDGTHDLVWSTLEEMERRLCVGPTLPAPPGYVAIEAVLGGEGEGELILLESDVIAFRHGVAAHEEPLAISVDGELGGWAHGIRRPDGKICVPYIASEMSAEEFRAHCLATLRAQLEAGGA